jgi:hypothetical protein
MGRVLIAYLLHRDAAATFRFYLSDKLEHLRAIEASDEGDLEPLIVFIRARIAR